MFSHVHHQDENRLKRVYIYIFSLLREVNYIRNVVLDSEFA